MIKKGSDSKEQEIRKKLENVKDHRELRKLLYSLNTQNKTLVEDIRTLRNRVNVLMEKKKLEEDKKKQQKEKNQQQQQQLQQAQKQLSKKYKQMKKLKKELGHHEEIEDVKNNRQKIMNQIANMETKINQYQKDISDLLATQKKLNKTMESWEKQDHVNEPKIKELSTENKQIRDKMNILLKKGYQKQYESIKVQTTLFSNKKRIRDNQIRKSMFDLKAEPVTNKKDILAEYEALERQVKELRQQVHLVEETEQQKKYQRMSMRDQLKLQNKDKVQTMRNLDYKKTKAQRQNNMYKKKWLDICKKLDKLRNRVKKVQNECQITEYVDENPLRREYAGILGRNRTDDRLVLKDNKTTKIIGITVYETDRGLLSALQAHYDNEEKSAISLPPSYMAKCKATKVTTGEDDFFKLFKIKYNSLDNRIVKVEFRSNKNIRYQYGDKKPFGQISDGDIVYGFDVRIHEYPVCMFISYVYSKGIYFMEGLGMQINDMQ